MRMGSRRLKRGDCVEIGTDAFIHPQADWLKNVASYKAKKHIRNYLKQLPKQKYILCPHCHPMPGSEIIGFEDADKQVIIHGRNCPEAIRMACEKGNMIVAIDDFEATQENLYPVRMEIIGIDRFHLLQDVLDCIVGEHFLSISRLSSISEDNIVECNIEFSVHSAEEFKKIVACVSLIQGVEEVKSFA